MNTATQQYQSKAKKQPCGCGCQDGEPDPVTCCNLVCFERPHYFCGHLLTDEDLALEQRYTVEKNKLRNRTLHGHGVVCGLGLSCDCECEGYIWISTGYAIDDCGNDLVVCEPLRFNVVDALRKKNLLLGEGKPGPCDDDDDDDIDCEIKQCFYVTACYYEEMSNYTTPFDSGCASGPKQCLPTRVSERVRFEVADKIPKTKSTLEELKDRIQKCYKAFTEGQVGQTIKSNAERIQQALSGNAAASTGPDDLCKLLCLIRAHFLHHMKAHPDTLNCNLHKEAKDIKCPEANSDLFGNEIRDAFCELLGLIEKYQYDCVLSSVLYQCLAPCEAHCVVLGTVEVLSGKILRVCNTPRRYVWSFVSLLPLIYQYIAMHAPKTKSAAPEVDPDTGAPAGTPGHVPEHNPDIPEKPKTTNCHPDYPLGPDECRAVLQQTAADVQARKYAALSPLMAVDDFMGAVLKSFNFLDPNAVSPHVLKAQGMDKLMSNAVTFGVAVHPVQSENLMSVHDPIHALMSNMLVYRGDALMAAAAAGTNEIRLSPHITTTPAANVPGGPATGEDLQRIATEAKAGVDELRNSLQDRDRRIEELTKRLDAMVNPPQPSPNG